jgi:predicted PurR-regulated permease PerM
MPEPVKHLIQWLRQKWPVSVAIVLALYYFIAKVYPLIKNYFELIKQAREAQKVKFDIDKTKLEINKLEKESHRVTLATAAEVAAYDPKTKRLLEKFEQRRVALTQTPVLIFVIIGTVFFALFQAFLNLQK